MKINLKNDYKYKYLSLNYFYFLENININHPTNQVTYWRTHNSDQ